MYKQIKQKIIRLSAFCLCLLFPILLSLQTLHIRLRSSKRLCADRFLMSDCIARYYSMNKYYLPFVPKKEKTMVFRI